MLSRDQLDAALDLVHATMLPTPMLHWPLLSKALRGKLAMWSDDGR